MTIHTTRWKGMLAVALAVLAVQSGGVARAQLGAFSPGETQLESFLGLASGDLSNLNNGPVLDGSAIKQTVTVAAGDTLSFHFDFLTNSPTTSPLSTINDFAFVTIPQLTDFADVVTSPLKPSSTPFAQETGYQTFSVTIPTAGTYTLGIGVANVTTDDFNSALLLSGITLSSGGVTNGNFATGDFTGFSTSGNASVTSNFFGVMPAVGSFQAALVTPVPEPASLTLLGMGLCGGTALARRYRRRPPA